jgi:hypothetical protein
VQGIKPKVSCMLVKCSTTELHLQSRKSYILGMSKLKMGILCVL